MRQEAWGMAFTPSKDPMGACCEQPLRVGGKVFPQRYVLEPFDLNACLHLVIDHSASNFEVGATQILTLDQRGELFCL